MTRLARSRALLVGLVATVVLAVAGTTYAQTMMRTDVTLVVDGSPRQISASGSTVGDVLAQEGIDLDQHDVVAPSPEESITDGTRIALSYGKRLTVVSDGQTRHYWVTATDVQGALEQIGRRFSGADLSISRGGQIDRSGTVLKVTTPKKLTFVIAGAKPKVRTLAVSTVRQALTEMHVKIGKRDEVAPGFAKRVRDGMRIVFTDVRVARKRVKAESVGYSTVERPDSSLPKGQSEVVREGRDGLRDVTYRLTFRNGEIVDRAVLKARSVRAPVDRIVRVGTQEAAPAPVYSGGSTVWDQLAQCESGGNWAANTGNGYYGGLQFNLGTWHSYGGPGYPNTASRETQIAIATKVRNASGGYGAWPACAASLGLPR
ncbi:transglycosylase family protein [Nocardioides acrostichi]|uniref:Transglycosylase family protein n=1 Tax=Nocardioides acrostichi TaxID=2784339 RepID=A0A930V090_9ACTN|nr:resuscitation-promoting factor [Nocardioides acrostichi]MBF4161639.1 transglycosylase family protein [Nocardioides acrostichi]